MFEENIQNENMKLYTFKKEQQVNTTLDAAWDFFSSPKNLKEITPEYMGFKITSDLGNGKMYAGQLITYIVTPLLGIPLRWATEITQVKDKEYFIDEQRFGPYAFWHHQHWFEENETGVLMKDVVTYGLPLGFIGRIGNQILVKSKLEEIFDYRVKVVNKIFNS